MAVSAPAFSLDQNPPRASAGADASATVLVVDDHDLLRLGFRALVQADPATGIEVLEAASLAEALRVYAEHGDRIGMVFLDLGLRDTQGLDGLAAFRRTFPGARIVVLSGALDDALSRGVLAMGALAFLPKSADLREVVSFIRAAGLTTGQLPDPAPAATAPLPVSAHGQALTPRQTQVLQWVLQGLSNKDIAQLAQVSEGTVKNHVSTLLLLYGVRSRAQLISTLR